MVQAAVKLLFISIMYFCVLQVKTGRYNYDFLLVTILFLCMLGAELIYYVYVYMYILSGQLPEGGEFPGVHAAGAGTKSIYSRQITNSTKT